MIPMPTTAALLPRSRSARHGTGSRRSRQGNRCTRSWDPRHVVLARYYDPTIGRFTATDPLADLSSPGTLDAYGYSSGSPVTLSDPTGLLNELGGGGSCISKYCTSTKITSEQKALIDSVIGSPGGSGNKVLDEVARENGYRPLPVQGDRLRGLLELAGFIPLVGDAIDGALCGYSAGGGGGGAGYDCAAMIPIFGSFGRGAKHADEAWSAVTRAAQHGDEAGSALQALRRTVSSGAGGSLDNIHPADALRIQNASNKIGRPISVVGSRAAGKSGPLSDWDYVIEGANSRVRASVRNSLPEGHRGIGEARNLDLFSGALDSTRPYVTFTPQAG